MMGLTIGLGLRPADVPWFAVGSYSAEDSADNASKNAALVADLSKQKYAQTIVSAGSISATSAAGLGIMAECAFSDLITLTRAGSATYIDSTGTMQTAATDVARFDYTNSRRQLLVEPSATNLCLNTDTPSTQSVTVTAQAYTLSFYGTGSITRSGTSTGTTTGTGASTRTTVTFTPTAGSLTLTLSGSVTKIQLETGSFATSYYPSTGTQGTRAADLPQLGAKATALLALSSCGVVIKGQGLWSAGAGRMIGGASGTRIMGLAANNTNVGVGNTTTPLLFGTVTVPTPAFGFAGAWNGSGKAGSYNGSTIATNAAVQDAVITSAYLGRDNAGSHASGWYDELVIYPFRPSNAALVSKAVAYS